MSRTPARITQADVARAIRAAQQCGAGQTFIYFLRAGEFVKIGQVENGIRNCGAWLTDLEEWFEYKRAVERKGPIT